VVIFYHQHIEHKGYHAKCLKIFYGYFTIEYHLYLLSLIPKDKYQQSWNYQSMIGSSPPPIYIGEQQVEELCTMSSLDMKHSHDISTMRTRESTALRRINLGYTQDILGEYQQQEEEWKSAQSFLLLASSRRCSRVLILV
jgi:hypothetical protein